MSYGTNSINPINACLYSPYKKKKKKERERVTENNIIEIMDKNFPLFGKNYKHRSKKLHKSQRHEENCTVESVKKWQASNSGH